MRYVCGRALSDRGKILNVFNKQLKTTEKNHCSVNRLTADCTCLNHDSMTDGQHKMKRLKSRKERSQMRGGKKEASTSKSHHHHCRRQSSKDMAHFQNGCHSSCHCPSRRDAPFPNIIPAAQEPSIITDGRLIGHHGLFNHEVKSIDIERLLSEQRKRGTQVHEKNNATSHPSSASHIPSPLSINALLGEDTDEVLPIEKAKAHDDCRKKEKKISQGMDVTPVQRSQQQPDLSPDSVKSISSAKHSSLDAVIVKSKKTNPVMSEKGRESQLTPTVVRENVKTLNRKVKGNVISTLEHTPKNKESLAHQTRARGLSPSSPQPSSSPTADSSDIQNRRRDPDCVSKSVSTLAAGLCDCLQFPLLRRNLVAESREVLLKALRERHGPRLQENLIEVQRCISFGADPTKKIQDQEPTMIDKLSPSDAFTTAFQAATATQPCSDTEKTTSFRMMGTEHFNWKSRPHQNLEQTAEWLTSPVETSVSLLDDILRPTCTPQFYMDYEPSGVTASDHLFSPTSCWGEKASASHHWEDSFNRPKSKEAVMFDSFENASMNHTRAVPERSSGSQFSGINIQRFFPYQTHLPDRHSPAPTHFPQEKDPFEVDRSSFAPSFAQIQHPQQSFQPFSQFSHPSPCPPLRSHHTDMMHYPPSHMLERDTVPPLSSFPSPGHWSFPPMRLY
ncbi:uncharacterized protein si:dkey-250k15.4 [Sander lucioperca]|uniref:uncharacterized protein si:dkey-250k15.4 n=1 Tax=Sander lucioperca TaxID=283035 RepID=UPI00125D0EC7|nr:uncharacterized protein si:dkey-250k15.4 [Sander lucioperca]XP_031144297.1 uncharacterized protein si:dkey-250k15.4 [Sander lucioperca]